MLVFVIRRSLQSVLVLFVMSVLVFDGIYAAANPIDILISPQADPIDRERAIAAVGLTYLLSSHDLGVVEHIGERVVIVCLGRVVESEVPGELFAAPAHPCAQALLNEAGKVAPGKRTFVPIRGEIPLPLDRPPGCHFHPCCPHALPRCRTEVLALRPMAPGRRSAWHLHDSP